MEKYKIWFDFQVWSNVWILILGEMNLKLESNTWRMIFLFPQSIIIEKFMEIEQKITKFNLKFTEWWKLLIKFAQTFLFNINSRNERVSNALYWNS